MYSCPSQVIGSPAWAVPKPKVIPSEQLSREPSFPAREVGAPP